MFRCRTHKLGLLLMLLMLFLQTTTSTKIFVFRRLVKYLRAPSAVTVVATTMKNQEVHQHKMDIRASFDDDSVFFSNAISNPIFFSFWCRCCCCCCFILFHHFFVMKRYLLPGRINRFFLFFFSTQVMWLVCVCVCVSVCL